METRSKKNDNAEKLKIIPIQEEDQKLDIERPLHPNLPNIYRGQLVCIVAPIRSGKSTIWNNMLLNDNFYNDLFPQDAVTIISNTIRSDSSARFAYQKYKTNCHDIYSDKIIKDLIKRQKAKLENKEKKTGFCLILDDLLGNFPKQGRRGMEAIHFATRFRHFCKRGSPCMVIYSSQNFTDINPIIRNNATAFLISGNIRNAREIETITHTFCDSFGGSENFNKMLTEVRSKGPYHWLHLRLDSCPPQAYIDYQTQLF